MGFPVKALSVLALVLGILFGVSQFDTESTPKALLVDIELPDVLGDTQNGEQWLGKVVVVNHWATWCPPCVREIPLLVEFQKQLGDQGLQVVGIAHDFTEAARVFGDQIGIDYPSLVISAGGSELMKLQGNSQGSALPFTAVFDREGQLSSSWLGELDSEVLLGMVKPLL